MKAVLPLIVLFFCLLFLDSKSQTPDDTWAVKFSNAIISRYQPNINAMTGKAWEYSNTIITHGMEKVYNDVTDSVKYLNYIKGLCRCLCKLKWRYHGFSYESRSGTSRNILSLSL